MALRSGLGAQFGFAEETTWSTYKTPDHFTEFVSESMKLDRTRTPAKGIRAGKTMPRSTRFRTTKIQAGGAVNLEMNTNTMGLLWKHSLGTSSSIASGAGFKRTYTLGDPFGLGLTVQIGTVAISSTVFVRSYTGCKVTDWDLSTAIDSPLDFTLTFDAFNEDTSQALATASYASPTTSEIFFANDCALTIAGQTLKSYDFKLTGKNNEKVDRYYVGAQTKGEPILNAFRDITGQITTDFNDLTIYNYFVNDVTATGSIVMTATGQKNYDTGLTNKLVITIPVVRYEGETPMISGPDLVRQTVPFVVMDDDVQVPITVDYYTKDSAD
jgi:Phage tail tube protein